MAPVIEPFNTCTCIVTATSQSPNQPRKIRSQLPVHTWLSDEILSHAIIAVLTASETVRQEVALRNHLTDLMWQQRHRALAACCENAIRRGTATWQIRRRKSLWRHRLRDNRGFSGHLGALVAILFRQLKSSQMEGCYRATYHFVSLLLPASARRDGWTATGGARTIPVQHVCRDGCQSRGIAGGRRAMASHDCWLGKNIRMAGI